MSANVVTDSNVTTDSNVVTDSNVTTDSNVVGPVMTVSRFELYPKEEPTCYCVGFSITCNNQTIYRDTQVPLETAAGCGCETEIAQQAYDSLKDSIDAWVTEAASKPRLIGQVFVPNSHST